MMTRPNQPSIREIKLVLIGDSGVGKSSLVLRYVNGSFDKHVSATIGCSFMSKMVESGGETYKYNIWDTAGQERFKSLGPIYYRGSHVAIVVYDLTSERTFNSLKRWVKEVQQNIPNIVIAIAANKCDLEDAPRQVEREVGEQYAQSIDALFAEVSALTSENVSKIFEGITEKLPADKSAGYSLQSGFISVGSNKQIGIGYNKQTGVKLRNNNFPSQEEEKCC